MDESAWLAGIDVGSTTIKTVVSDPYGHVVWQDHHRHEARQAEHLLGCLRRVEGEVGGGPAHLRLFITGAGGAPLADLVGARYVHEAAAVAVMIDRRHPEVRSAVELGGQHASIIVFKAGSGGHVRKIASMNDKCAGGTGAVIDKMAAKLGLSPEDLGRQGYDGVRLHHVAGKCGVFAETDINSLQKQGIPAGELMASLLDAIVVQNLAVLARGQTLLPRVLLLGGPCSFIPGVREAWVRHLTALWTERGIELPAPFEPGALVEVPPLAPFYGALGAVELGRDEPEHAARYLGTAALEDFLASGRTSERLRSATRALAESASDVEAFARQFGRLAFVPPTVVSGDRLRCFLGVDGGSTSTKAVLLSEQGDVVATSYQLSRGNPIQDTMEVVEQLRRPIESQGASIEVLGVGTTGYAKDLVSGAIGADVALVETVAHAKAALHLYQDVDVIADVGGQDIKLIFLKDGRVADFRLNTQCSAGNGYYLQATAESFGIPVEQYADAAFSARSMPVFGYGCAVFLQSDIVNFLRLGWTREEILAGLAAVLPKNVWLYVARMPNLPRLGTRFVLQGGTQNNLAAVKAQVDFIRSRFSGTGREPEIIVHRFAGEAGAIGTALEAMDRWHAGRTTSFVGLDAVGRICYQATRNEDTRCSFCTNRCPRTFIDITIDPSTCTAPGALLPPGGRAGDSRRIIVATCEKGAFERPEDVRQASASISAIKRQNPNLVDRAARDVWRSPASPDVADPPPSHPLTAASRRRAALFARRRRLRVGLPRVLNLYAYAPLFAGYLESLGVPPHGLVYSDFTSEELFRRGSTRGAIDPCFPSKVALAHIHDLLTVKHKQRPLDVLFFPMFDSLRPSLDGTLASDACPTVALTPETVKAAFIRERDLFAERGVLYLNPLVSLGEPTRFELQMFEAWAPILGLTRAENRRAIEQGLAALTRYERGVRSRAREALARLERDGRVGIVMLGRPYHHDPGINHGILEELQRRGYTIFSQSTLPMDEAFVERFFGPEVEAGLIRHPLDISDVWEHTFSANTSDKLWAAKLVARHPNLVALEVSSFKCGLDAPISTAVESIIGCGRTPYFAFKDVDENRPAGSIKLRVETIDYFLARHGEWLARQRPAREAVERALEQWQEREGNEPLEAVANSG